MLLHITAPQSGHVHSPSAAPLSQCQVTNRRERREGGPTARKLYHPHRWHVSIVDWRLHMALLVIHELYNMGSHHQGAPNTQGSPSRSEAPYTSPCSSQPLLDHRPAPPYDINVWPTIRPPDPALLWYLPQRRGITVSNDLHVHPGPDSCSIKFRTLNVGGQHISKARCFKLFREITQDSPDIVALLEVIFRNNAFHNQKAWIARLLPDYLPFSANSVCTMVEARTDGQPGSAPAHTGE